MRLIQVSTLVIILTSCSLKKNSSELYSKRLNEAKWLYYELNFKPNKILCNQEIFYDSSICFIEELKIDTLSYGDTFQITLYSSINSYELCVNSSQGFFLNVFGFYPNRDTVTYISSYTLEPDRKPQCFYVDTFPEYYGITPRKEQEILFKDFLVKNENKLNTFLKEEARRKGYIK